MPNWIGETPRLIPVNATGDSGREHGTEGPLCPEEAAPGLTVWVTGAGRAGA